MKKISKTKGITIWEILVVILLSIISLFIIVRGITGISVSILRQTEFINCLGIAKSYIDIYSYYLKGSISEANINNVFNIGNLRYDVNITVEEFGNLTRQLNLRRLTVTVGSPRIRNLRVSLTTLI